MSLNVWDVSIIYIRCTKKNYSLLTFFIQTLWEWLP